MIGPKRQDEEGTDGTEGQPLDHLPPPPIGRGLLHGESRPDADLLRKGGVGDEFYFAEFLMPALL